MVRWIALAELWPRLISAKILVLVKLSVPRTRDLELGSVERKAERGIGMRKGPAVF